LLIFQLQFGRGFPLFFTTGNATKSLLRSFLSNRVAACFRNYNSPASEANRRCMKRPGSGLITKKKTPSNNLHSIGQMINIVKHI
jgi:hypothetical protein